MIYYLFIIPGITFYQINNIKNKKEAQAYILTDNGSIMDQSSQFTNVKKNLNNEIYSKFHVLDFDTS